MPSDYCRNMDAFERSMIDDNDSDASSVTIDNDPDRLYFLREADGTTTREFIDLTVGETIHDGEYVTDECFEILRDDWLTSARKARSPSPELPEREALEYVCCDAGIVYKLGHSVELYDETYLRICSIRRDTDGEILFGGRRLLKAKNHAGTYIPRWCNELVWIANETAEIPFSHVRRFVTIHFTNNCHIDEDDIKVIYPNCLFCRLKEVLQEDTTSVEYLAFEEADDGFRTKPTSLRRRWRGETTLFGSENVPEPRVPVVVLDDSDDDDQGLILKQRKERKYTFGDGFCGAGGVSCGADAAGLHIKWSFDLSQPATATYMLNFPMVVCEQSEVFDFLTNDEEFLRVDITHGSPPCQTFSPAHTIPGPNDEPNSACLFSCGNLIRRAKPRVHTMEETSGLFDRHQEWFFGVIRDFIETGYSVRWALLNCMKYGVPQSRKRLIIIASGPGETLPQLPRPTHGLPGSGLHNLTTISQMIRNIPRGAPDHDVASAQSRGSRNRRAPFDANQQARTITCGGGENNYHPSGLRGFTNREFACLQTFPLEFQFGRREVRKQIGNAVPPLFAKAIYKEIIRSLQETDERELGENR
ncbi:DNA cytosine methyltransferase [Aspergillus mulundensis]|uniref:DNA (cytosine-5-)-methyltransferase n=1 Tax=Aspergillus mulundensis TaxID=1810919 RepID=A0A3D8SC22_9EURO|nr:Uncharacterized protein DSM5745_04159 [Aspergillus mulundensis]RDW83833.1 Uncharacterized protein DSM5745_04159 [Aspergillus mulundensis]